MPAVVSVTAGVVEPRYPSFKGIMAAKSKPVDELTAADLGVTPGSGQQIVSVVAAEATATRNHQSGFIEHRTFTLFNVASHNLCPSGF